MSQLNTKINQYFAGLVVRKDLVKTVKGNAIVPSYVLEYLLGQYCATNDEESISTGIETVKEILRRHYVHRNEAGLIRSNIKEKGRYKVIDKISVSLNEKADVYEASFNNLGIKKVLVDSNTIKAHPKLLVSGVWCIADVEYEFFDEDNTCPWILASLKPIQLSHFDFESYSKARKEFTTDEWIDLLIQSIGFNPEFFSKRSKLTQLIRLIPFCERNYNLIELGPKGTGKSHIYSEFSPHGILLSGGEVTVAKLFVNNSTGKIGLVGYWDTVAFDEFAGKQKRIDKALVDILKNYMANKSFSRGIETLGAEASLVFVGNTQHNVPYMLKHSDLFADLPDKFYDSAFLDRIHYYIPGWEIDIIRGEMFSDGYGFVVDYLAEILRYLRNYDYSDRYQPYFSLTSDISARDRDGIHKTFSGLMKILFPETEATATEIEEILKFAIEGRKRVKDQLIRIDPTYSNVHFAYQDTSGNSQKVETLEEKEYPRYYHQEIKTETLPENQDDLQEMSQQIEENQKGISFDILLGKYLKNAHNITIIDRDIRTYEQIKNLMELLETVIKFKSEDEEITLNLITQEDEVNNNQQKDAFSRITQSCLSVGINFKYSLKRQEEITQGCQIITDHGWEILLSEGLDIFQKYEQNDLFTFTNRLPQLRLCKAFEITYLSYQSK
jgi:ATP-dependent Lon protease